MLYQLNNKGRSYAQLDSRISTYSLIAQSMLKDIQTAALTYRQTK